MLILVDGHNLVPKIPGMSLADVDDENQLVSLLQSYCRARRNTVEVYFDRAPVGQAGKRGFGQVTAYFVRDGITADEAIMARLKALGKRARNVKVVSSDRQVQAAVRGAHAGLVTSDEFSRELQAIMEETPSIDPRNRLLGDDELAEWETLFRRGHPPVNRED